MKTLTVFSKEMVGPAASRGSMVQNALLACGVVSSLLYVAATVIGGMLWKGYSPIHQAVSELSAIGAPSRPFMIPLGLLYSVLVIAAGAGVWKAAGRKRSLRIAGGLIVGYGVACLTGPFTPMNLPGAERSLTDTLHLVSTAVDVLFIFLIIGFGANALGKRFRIYSIGTFLLLFALGAFFGNEFPKIAKKCA